MRPAPVTGSYARTGVRAAGGLPSPAGPWRSLPVLACAGLAGTVTAALVRRAGDLLRDPWAGVPAHVLPPGVRVEDVVELGAVVVGGALAAWFTLGLLVATACTVARGLGGAWQSGERLLDRAAPVLVRRVLALSAGAGMALTGPVTGAIAATPPPEDLGWAVTAEPSPGPPAQAQAPPPAAAAVVTVRPGDTLWGIARDHLPPGATVVDVATAWPRWYTVNAGVVGPDPDLIRPGQRLVPPAGVAPDGAVR